MADAMDTETTNPREVAMFANIDNLGTLIAETAMKAAADLLIQQGRAKSVDVDALIVALRRESRGAIDRILDQGKTLIDSGNPGWLDAMVRAECFEAAKAAVASL
jgi:hypothetical protein